MFWTGTFVFFATQHVEKQRRKKFRLLVPIILLNTNHSKNCLLFSCGVQMLMRLLHLSNHRWSTFFKLNKSGHFVFWKQMIDFHSSMGKELVDYVTLWSFSRSNISSCLTCGRLLMLMILEMKDWTLWISFLHSLWFSKLTKRFWLYRYQHCWPPKPCVVLLCKLLMTLPHLSNLSCMTFFHFIVFGQFAVFNKLIDFPSSMEKELLIKKHNDDVHETTFHLSLSSF